MDQNQIYDIQTIEVMKRTLRINSNAIDIGCHRGSMLIEMLKIALFGQHYAFEPLPNMFAHLQADFGANPRVLLKNYALSDVCGHATFHNVTSNPAYSGLRRRHYDRDNEVIQEIQVETARLDDIVPDDFDVKFIKIDVEGAELQVLRGGIKLVARCKPVIVFEHGIGAADFYGTRPEDVFDLLVDDAGLFCFTMNDWLGGGKKSLSRSEFCDEYLSGRNYYFMAARGASSF